MNCLECEHVWARYGRAWALKDVTLGIEHGCLLAVMGSAGAGKSTLLKAASGALGAGAGRVWVDGRAVARTRTAIIGPNERLMDALGVERFIERRTHASGPRGRAAELRVKAALQAWDLSAFRSARIRTLPDSTRGRVALAAQWACAGALWLLDDPTAYLEPAWRAEVPGLLRAWLEREGGAVVLATHEAETACAANKVAILSRGRLAALGTPGALCAACAMEEIIIRTVDPEAAAAALKTNLRLVAERLPDGLRVRVGKADEALPGILQTVAAQIETVWIRRPSLRDAVAHFSGMAIAPNAPRQPPRHMSYNPPRSR